MRSMIFALVAGASLTVAGAAAEAMPASPVATPSSAPEVTLVAGGCGPGFHRAGPYGACVRNFYRPAYGYYAPGPYYRPYARCGLRIGPIGLGGPC